MPDDPLDVPAGALARGDEAAFRQVYDLTSSLLLSVANGLLGNRALAEEVVQDAFLRLVVHAPDLRQSDGRALRAWLLRTTRNRCLDVRGSAARRREHADDFLPDVGAEDPGLEHVLEGDLNAPLRRTLAALTEDQRAVLVLVHVAGLSGHEVADVMGRNRAAVYSILRRAERAARASLGASGEQW